jgi:hypothetical protein
MGINPGRALYTPRTTSIQEHQQLQTSNLVYTGPYRTAKPSRSTYAPTKTGYLVYLASDYEAQHMKSCLQKLSLSIIFFTPVWLHSDSVAINIYYYKVLFTDNEISLNGF